ncbi:MAG: acyl-CoA/acyl-ACP dehydrogenase [Polyangiaceae bacterium]|nr:acyl-CoA/acyl-ACP dehydrogenase [Polyangiaceae bacterium]
MTTAWQRLCPHAVWRDAPIAAIERELETAENVALLRRLEVEEAYPAPLLARLDELGVARCFADPSCATPHHVGALAEVLARASGSLAITVAVNALALLPAYVAARPDQLEYVLCRVRDGARAAILLTELRHGSDLLRTETRGEPGRIDEAGVFVRCGLEDATHVRICGEKHLINGGSEHSLLFVLARTGGAESGSCSDGDHASLFLIERGPSVDTLPKWRTLAASGADISGARFRDTVVPIENAIGRLGDGIAVIHKTLAISRGGVSALAAGTAAAARRLATAHAYERELYGASIAKLGAITEHLARAHALELACAALSVKQAAVVNGLGPGASYHAAAAKWACCALAEEAVTEGRRVLGARALLREHPYERLVRDVLLYGVFDGTSHVVLEQLHWRLAQLAARDAPAADEGEETFTRMSELYRAPPRSFAVVARLGARPWVPSPETYLRALAMRSSVDWLDALADLAGALLKATRGCRESGRWDRDQALRHVAGEQLASIEVLIALAELGEASVRSTLGLSPLEGSPDELSLHRDSVTYARTLLGARIVAGLRWMTHAAAETVIVARELDPIEHALTHDLASARTALHERFERAGANALTPVTEEHK